jgi:hypothetical protein
MITTSNSSRGEEWDTQSITRMNTPDRKGNSTIRRTAITFAETSTSFYLDIFAKPALFLLCFPLSQVEAQKRQVVAQ